nr:hypothetical protein [Herpetosiphonaceae bacterium]
MSAVRRRLSLVLLVVTLLSLLPRASASAVVSGDSRPLPAAYPQSAPLPTLTQLPTTDPPTRDQQSARMNAADPVDPTWDDEHFPMFNPVLAKPFVVGPTSEGGYTRARTVNGPNNSLHSVFYRTAIGAAPAGWYYTASPHIQNGLL